MCLALASGGYWAKRKKSVAPPAVVTVAEGIGFIGESIEFLAGAEQAVDGPFRLVR